MSLVTGTPLGSLTTAEDMYIEGAPTIFYQDSAANPLKNPDSNGFYWGLSGTTAYPVNEMGCVTAVTLTENLTMNDVLCDNVGVKSTIMQRNYLEFTFTLQSLFPFSALSPVMKGSAVTNDTTNHLQEFGLGQVTQNKYYHVYAPKVYDQDVGDYLLIHLHKAQFVDAWTLNMSFGTPWQLTNIKFRAFADTTKPSTQYFATIVRSDASVIV
jgi:hypothetical protein